MGEWGEVWGYLKREASLACGRGSGCSSGPRGRSYPRTMSIKRTLEEGRWRWLTPTRDGPRISPLPRSARECGFRKWLFRSLRELLGGGTRCACRQDTLGCYVSSREVLWGPVLQPETGPRQVELISCIAAAHADSACEIPCC